MVMPMYNSLEYSDNYSRKSGGFGQYYKDESFLNNNRAIADFPDDNNNNSVSFKFKTKIAGRITNNGTKDVKTMVSLKYLRNFWRTFEMPLINCEINLNLTWSANCFTIDASIANQYRTLQ